MAQPFIFAVGEDVFTAFLAVVVIVVHCMLRASHLASIQHANVDIGFGTVVAAGTAVAVGTAVASGMTVAVRTTQKGADGLTGRPDKARRG